MSVVRKEVHIWTGVDHLIGNAMTEEEYLALAEKCGIDRGIAKFHWWAASPGRGALHASPSGEFAPKDVRIRVRTITEEK